MFFLARLSEDG